MDSAANRVIKIWGSIRYVLRCGFLLQVGIAAAQNLATNPGFETGNTTGWSAFGSTTISATTLQVHSGTYAGLVTNRTASYMGIFQSFLSTMQVNQTYTVSVWVRLAGGANQTMQVTAQKTDGGGTTYAAIASGTVSAGAWTQLAGLYTLTVSGTLTGLTIYLEVPTSTNAAYFADDFLVQAVSTAGTNGQCTVDWNNVFQRIDGFGASSAWRSTWNSTLADLLFSTNNGIRYTNTAAVLSTNNGIGLSLLRTRINPSGGTDESSIMQLAQARGAKVWSAPWTPPPQDKDSGVINGGNYLGSGANATNLAYASYLANYLVKMKALYGVNIYAISVQNEPNSNHPDTYSYITNTMTGVITTNIASGYESCIWTALKIHDFTTNLYNAMVASNVASTKIILPEDESWQTGLYTTAMNDPAVATKVGIIACHNYVANNNTGDQAAPAALPNYGKALWETEVSLLSGSDGSIANGIYYAGRIHLFMTVAQANAWHYWWLITGSSNGNQGLMDATATPTKRMFALGQFSRFVRPNYYRIGADNNGSALISAYKDSLSPGFAIVAINSSSTTVTQVFNFTNFTAATTLTPWITSSNLSLASQTGVTVANSSFTYILPAMSIVTFVGQKMTNSAPVLAPVADQVINPGVALNITNSAMDLDIPSQYLTFTLLDGPTNGTLVTDGSGTNGIFSWRPLVSQAATTNLVSVKVTDSGMPALSATNNFNIVINSPARPVLDSIAVSSGRVNLVATGTQGPDYTLLTTTNLASSWQVLFTTNSPVTPVTLVNTNLSDASRFYRIQIGP